MFLMYSWNATHPRALPLWIPQGALQISAVFERSLFAFFAGKGTVFRAPWRTRQASSQDNPSRNHLPSCFVQIWTFLPGCYMGALQGPTAQWYLLSSLPTKPKRKVQEMSVIPTLMMPFPSNPFRNTALLLPCTRAHLLTANTSWFTRAEAESKPFLFVYTTNHQFGFWLWTKFCCFTALDQHKIKCLQRNCYS